MKLRKLLCLLLALLWIAALTACSGGVTGGAPAATQDGAAGTDGADSSRRRRRFGPGRGHERRCADLVQRGHGAVPQGHFRGLPRGQSGPLPDHQRGPLRRDRPGHPDPHLRGERGHRLLPDLLQAPGGLERRLHRQARLAAVHRRGPAAGPDGPALHRQLQPGHPDGQFLQGPPLLPEHGHRRLHGPVLQQGDLLRAGPGDPQDLG